jgi:hypothetical protein
MVFMTSQALICQKVEAEALFNAPEPASGQGPDQRDHNKSEVDTYVAAPTAVCYSSVASKTRPAAPASPLASTRHFLARMAAKHSINLFCCSKLDLSPAKETLKNVADVGDRIRLTQDDSRNADQDSAYGIYLQCVSMLYLQSSLCFSARLFGRMRTSR